jgi:hypothetical protein
MGMADFRLTGAWPVLGGRLLVPPGAELELADWQYQGTPLPELIPICVLCLTQAGADAWSAAYPYDYERKRFFGVEGVVLPE